MHAVGKTRNGYFLIQLKIKLSKLEFHVIVPFNVY
jgi:hypothetical protein